MSCKNKGDVQIYSNCRGIKLMSHTMMICEIVMALRLEEKGIIYEQQYGFIPNKGYYRHHV